jgi:hypothetical protein
MWTYILKQASKILFHPEVVNKLLCEEMEIQHITVCKTFFRHNQNETLELAAV